MSQEPPSQITKRRHLPTHLQTADKFQIGMISFTMRQGFIVLVGCLVSYFTWKQFAVLSEYGLVVVRIGSAVAVLLLALMLAIIKINGRDPEVWALIWFTYIIRPRHYRWERLIPAEEESQEAPRRPKWSRLTAQDEPDIETQEEAE